MNGVVSHTPIHHVRVLQTNMGIPKILIRCNMDMFKKHTSLVLLSYQYLVRE